MLRKLERRMRLAARPRDLGQRSTRDVTGHAGRPHSTSTTWCSDARSRDHVDTQKGSPSLRKSSPALACASVALDQAIHVLSHVVSAESLGYNGSQMQGNYRFAFTRQLRGGAQ